MKNTNLTTIFLTAIAGLALAAAPGRAATIAIVNNGFENSTVTGNTLSTTITGWSSADIGTFTSNGIAYVINEAHTNVTPPADPVGERMAMLRYDAILYQVLTTKIAANTTYTLTIDAALRDTIASKGAEPTGSTIRLGTGSTAGGNLLTPISSTIGALSDTSWTSWTATFTTGATVADEFLRVEMYWPLTSGDQQGLFDNVRLTASSSGGGNNFSDWIAGYSVGGQTGIGDDPDLDGIDSGVENFFGTAPDTFTQGLAAGAVDAVAGTFTFTHPQTGTIADDLTAAYRWSKDLQSFNADGATDGDGTKVDFTVQLDTPQSGTTTVTATVDSGGTATDKLFVDVQVTQN